MMLTRNRLGLPQLAQKHLDRDDAPVRDAAHRRDGRRSRVRGQGTIHPGAFLEVWPETVHFDARGYTPGYQR